MSNVIVSEVIMSRVGMLGSIILNRPKALNALTHGMVVSITEALTAWEQDDAVQTVVISGAGDRGLCAGGDIVGIYRSAKDGSGDAERFWRDEYRLNSFIARYPKPFVAIMDGIVLGGGIGISAHASLRIVTERTKVGMPEVGIGFAPDVGGTLLLARAPGELGTHLALTGAMATGADAIALGIADTLVQSGELPALLVELQTEAAGAVIARHSTPAPPAPLDAARGWIDAAYAGDDARGIVARLAASEVEDARSAASTILSKSPTSVSVALAALRRVTPESTLDDVLEQEYRVGLRFLEGTEIVEGIRAQVIDKDRNPAWSPSSLDGVTREQVEHYFAPLGERELDLDASDRSTT
ncbi:enoyl-CoA hydratase [Salinibacterium sp. CAN_S4]|uniref:enoyl-CoA hydratase/isomerase family protein n=1 Tax=Salinibacterium sp. CAN_S4 TaxID=2787727 RepID=UPI0018EFCF88